MSIFKIINNGNYNFMKKYYVTFVSIVNFVTCIYYANYTLYGCLNIVNIHPNLSYLNWDGTLDKIL